MGEQVSTPETEEHVSDSEQTVAVEQDSLAVQTVEQLSKGTNSIVETEEVTGGHKPMVRQVVTAAQSSAVTQA